jgi:hypothetical protein
LTGSEPGALPLDDPPISGFSLLNGLAGRRLASKLAVAAAGPIRSLAVLLAAYGPLLPSPMILAVPTGIEPVSPP